MTDLLNSLRGDARYLQRIEIVAARRRRQMSFIDVLEKRALTLCRLATIRGARSHLPVDSPIRSCNNRGLRFSKAKTRLKASAQRKRIEVVSVRGRRAQD